MPTIICSYCEYIGSDGKEDKYVNNAARIRDVEEHEKTCPERLEIEGGCSHCGAAVDKIHECHPFSSDAGAYFVCDVCNARFEPYEYEELLPA